MPDRPDLFDDLFGGSDDEFPVMPRHTHARHTAARSRQSQSCPPLGILLAYADQNDTSLTPRRRQRIRWHVHCCETCFTHVERAYEEVLHGVAEMLKDDYDFSQSVIRRRDSRFQQALHTQVKKTAPPLGSHHPLTRWLSIAATLTLAALVLGLMLLRPGAVVIHAEELIERAMAYEREHPGESRRVRQSLFAPAIAPVPGPAASAAPRAVPFSGIRHVVGGTFLVEM